MDRVALLDQAHAAGADVGHGLAAFYGLVRQAGAPHDAAMDAIATLVVDNVAAIQAWHDEGLVDA